MKKVLIALFLAALAGCNSPNDIVLGPEPLKQMADQGDKFKSMSQEDRTLLAGYLTINAFAQSPDKPITGRTVGEVMVDARAWRDRMKAAEVESKKREAEAAVLKAKVEAERKVIAAKIAGMVTVAVVDKKVLPKSYDAMRFDELLMLLYAVENKSGKVIRQIKGTVEIFDATGDKVGDLPIELSLKLAPEATIKTDTGRGWKVNPFSRGDIEKIAEIEFSSMSAKFTAESIAFDDGEVIKASN